MMSEVVRYHDDEHTEFVYYAVNNDSHGSPGDPCGVDGCPRDHVYVISGADRRARDEAIIQATFRAAWIARNKDDDAIIAAAEQDPT